MSVLLHPIPKTMTLLSHLYPDLLYIKQPIVHKVMFYVTLKIVVKIVPQKIQNKVKLKNRKYVSQTKAAEDKAPLSQISTEHIQIKLHHFRLENKQLKRASFKITRRN